MLTVGFYAYLTGGENMGVSKLQLFGLKFGFFYWNKKGPKNREF